MTIPCSDLWHCHLWYLSCYCQTLLWFFVVLVILFYQSFTATDIVTLFYENVLLCAHIVKLNYHQTFVVCLQLKLIISCTIFTIMFDKMPYGFIRHKSKTALKRNHTKILFASRYALWKQPRIIKHNCLFRTAFIKPFFTFSSKQLLSLLIVNY